MSKILLMHGGVFNVKVRDQNVRCAQDLKSGHDVFGYRFPSSAACPGVFLVKSYSTDDLF
jgi:hypothetical protein